MTLVSSNSNLTRKRYNRIAPFFDLLEAPIERLRFSAWRARLRDRILGDTALEVGVGTGKNLPLYLVNVQVTAVDLSPRMLERAQRMSAALDLLNPMVVQMMGAIREILAFILDTRLLDFNSLVSLT